MTEIKKNPAKLRDLQDYLYSRHKQLYPDSKLSRTQFLRSDSAKWGHRKKRNRKQRGIPADLQDLSFNYEQIFGSD